MFIQKWTLLRNYLGLTVINPQFFILREERRAVDAAVEKARGIVIDLGAGEQLYKKQLLEHAKSYIPVDLHNPINKSSDTYVKADITKKLPFGNNYCQTVCLFQVLEYIRDPLHVFSESHRILKKGGYFIFSSPFLYPVHDGSFDKVRWTKQALKEFLKEAGFSKIEVKKETSGFAFVANSLNMILLRSLFHLLKLKSIERFIGYPLIPFVWGLCTGINTAAVIGETLFPGGSAEFALNYTVVAKK